MKKIKYLGILGLLMGFSWAALAQQVIDRPQLFKRESPYERYTTYRVSLTGGLGLPSGTFGDYMDKTTLRNYTLAMDFVFPKNNLSVGFAVGSQYFQNRLPRQLYSFDDGDISAVQTRALSAYPLVLTGSYHIGKVNAPIRPYIQVGAGGAFAELSTYWGSLPTGDNGFKLVAQVGGGVRVLFKKTGNFGLEAGATYQYIPFNVESAGIKDVSSLNARAGLFYRWW